MAVRRIPGTDLQARVTADTERAVYHPTDGYLGIIVQVKGGWGTMDGRDWPTQREAAEHLLRRKRAPEAVYDHDCTLCVFLGRYKGTDLYVHPEKVDSIGTYITRTGNEGWEYESGAVFVGMNPHITEAHRRAVRDGLALTRGVGPARF